jgi:hypothetical protein
MKKQGKETAAEAENEGAGVAEGGKPEGKPEVNEKPEGAGGEGKPEGAEVKPEAGEAGEGGGKPEKPEAGETGDEGGGILVIEVEKPIGDASRWKRLDNRHAAYEIKDRGVILDIGLGGVFIPGTKLIPDINNGWRIVAG